MKYIHIASREYPVTRDQIKRNSGACIPREPTDYHLNYIGYACVTEMERPAYSLLTQKLTETEPIFEDGAWYQQWAVEEILAEELAGCVETAKRMILDSIDRRTDRAVMVEFVYEEQSVRLNSSDQRNYDGEYRAVKDYLSDGILESEMFPTDFKVWTDQDGLPVFIAFDEFKDMKAFIYAGRKYIKKCLKDGWQLKAGVPALSLSELEFWIDPRDVATEA
jgi:hypothetical protein